MTGATRLDDWISHPKRAMPAEELLGVRVLEVAPGRAEGRQDRVDPATVSLGWFGVLADTMSGRPVACSLPGGLSLSTVSMHLDLVAAPTAADCAALTASGRVITQDDSWALSRLTARGAGGGPLVVGTVRFLIHPEERETVIAVAPVAAADGRAAHGGDLAGLLGLRVRRVADGRAELTFDAEVRHANPYPIVHGGLHAALADCGLSRAVAASADGPAAGPELTLLTLDLNFHRPIPIGGDPVTVEARTLHRGRRVALAEATIRAATGKALTSARGTFGLLA